MPLMINKTSVPKETLTSVTNFFENYLYVPEDAYVYPYWIMGMHPQGI